MDKKKEKDTGLRGVDVDIANGEKATPKMVEEDVRELNNNPRDNDIDE
ncbi:MAG: hypothetical protein K2L91_01315 [Duncaniella sp.]|nr:hypothetical protein [Duncaniella sp.]MDE5919300.1 hypothetical protein [Duncaniella sp.]MDE6327148.1 hypothetical protein [Duncaniella sp.]MDE6465881.1 hypothetical protein [Duncaniella sp.]